MARPSRKHSSRLLSSLSFVFFLFLALIFLCPPAVSAEDKKSEYGTVIGIGTPSFFFFFSFSLSLIWFHFRLGNNVRGLRRALILTLLTFFFLFFAIQLFLCCVRVFASDLWISPFSDGFFSPF